MLFTTLLITAVLAVNEVSTQSQVRQSHCPQVLAYDNIQPDGTRYNANILIRTTRPLNGFKMDIELDRPIQLLGNTVGEVETIDNRHFSIIANKIIEPRHPFSLQIFVKYASGAIPYINSIKLDDRFICAPAENTVKSFNSKQPFEEDADQSTISRDRTTVRPYRVVDKFDVYNYDSSTQRLDDYTSRPSYAATTTTRPTRQPERDYRHENNRVIDTGSSSRYQPETVTSGGSSIPGGSRIECGKVHIPESVPLIIKGQATSKGQWPWHIAIYKSDLRTGNLNYQCGGTLLSRKSVITAAHCVTQGPFSRAVNANTLRVFVGKYHLKEWSEAGLQERGIAEVIVHPTYNLTAGFLNDIAILEFVKPVDYTAYVRPICMWDRSRTHINEVENQHGTVVGWGIDETSEVSEELMMTSLPVVSYATCIQSKPEHFVKFLRNTTYCAGYRNGTSACNGDSGGGMIFPTRLRDGTSQWYLRGLVSNSVARLSNTSYKRVCDPENYVVFTDVAKYLDWIHPYIKD